MRRTRLLILVAVALVAVLGVPASAHVQEIAVYGADFQPNGKLFAFGQIVCTPGETFLLRINIQQETGYAFGRANGECSGSPESATGPQETIGGTPWRTGQMRIKQGTIQCGPAIARLQVRTQEDRHRVSQSQEIFVCRNGQPS